MSWKATTGVAWSRSDHSQRSRAQLLTVWNGVRQDRTGRTGLDYAHLAHLTAHTSPTLSRPPPQLAWDQVSLPLLSLAHLLTHSTHGIRRTPSLPPLPLAVLTASHPIQAAALQTFLASKYLSGAKANAILARASEDGTGKRRKKKRKVEEGGGGGGGMRIEDEDEGWGSKKVEEDDEMGRPGMYLLYTILREMEG